MFLSLSRWRPRHLLAAWGAYWVGLAAIVLGPIAVAILRVTTPADGKGSASASFDGSAFKISVVQGTQTTWEGAASWGTIAFWVVVPPLLLWVAWLAAHRKPVEKPAPGIAPPPPADFPALEPGLPAAMRTQPVGDTGSRADRKERLDARLRVDRDAE